MDDDTYSNTDNDNRNYGQRDNYIQSERQQFNGGIPEINNQFNREDCRLLTVEIFHPKAPAIFYFITCLLSCFNLCNKDSRRFSEQPNSICNFWNRNFNTN